MADEYNTTAGATSILDEAQKSAALAFQDSSVFFGNLGNGLIWVQDISGMPTKSAEYITYAAVAVSATAAETTDMSNTAATESATILTVARQGVRVEPSDLQMASSVFDVKGQLGRRLGQGLAKNVDAAIFGVATTNHATSVGATNSTALTPDNFRAALLELEVTESEANGFWAALHPKQWDLIRDDLVFNVRSTTVTQTVTDGSFMGDQAMRGEVPELLGVKVIKSNRVTTGTDTNDMYLGFLAARGAPAADPRVFGEGAAVGFCWKEIPPMIEEQRDSSLAATELNLNAYHSYGIVRADGFCLVKSQTY